MNLSSQGLQLIKQSEGFVARVYNDAAGFATIGYGHKLLKGESYSGGIDEVQASNLLAADVAFAERCVESLVHVTLTQGQFDALVDFVFNMGPGRLASSTLLKDLNAGELDAAAHQLLLWDHAGSQELVLEGLKRRREAEYALWYQAA